MLYLKPKMEENKERLIRIFWINPLTKENHEMVFDDEEIDVITKYINSYMTGRGKSISVNIKSSKIEEND